MQVRLILARHGKAAHNVAYEAHLREQRGGPPGVPWDCPPDDPPLVAAGVRQARAAAAHLRARGLRPDIACVSPAARTRRTWIEYKFADVPTVIDPRLREQDGGLFDRLPLAATQEARERYTDEAARSLDARPPEGESVREHLERAEAWLREIVSVGGGTTVLAVTHYGTIALLGALCEGLPLPAPRRDRPACLTPGYGDLLGYRLCGGRWEREFVFRPRRP